MLPVLARSNAIRDLTGLAPADPASPDISCDIDVSSGAAWSQIVCGFEDANVDQSWAIAAEKWASDRLSTIVLRRDGDVIACALVIMLVVPVVRKGIAYVKMGPLWRRKGHEADPDALRLITDAIRQEYSLKRGLLVMALLPPDPEFGSVAASVFHEQNFKIRREMVDPNRYLLNVTLSEDEQLQSLQQKWRYNLRKSLKHDFQISSHETETALAEFITLYEAMARRKNLQEASPAEGLTNLIRELPEQVKPKIILVYYEGRPTAGAVIGVMGATASYLFGATDDRALPLKAGYAMQWWIVRQLGEHQDVRWYDLGGEAMEPGLRQFKKGLTGKAGRIVTLAGEFETWNDPISWLVAEGTTGIRSMSHNLKNLDLQKLRNWFKR